MKYLPNILLVIGGILIGQSISTNDVMGMFAGGLIVVIGFCGLEINELEEQMKR